MKILHSIAKDLFIQKNENATGVVNQNPGAADIKTDGMLIDTEENTNAASLPQSTQEDIESEIVAVLSEEKPLSPEEKKQIRQLLKTTILTKHEKIQALQTMLRKALPLTAEVMDMVHKGLTTDLLPQSLFSQLQTEPLAQDLLPLLLKQLISEVGLADSSEPLVLGDDLSDLLYFLSKGDEEKAVDLKEKNLVPEAPSRTERQTDSRHDTTMEVAKISLKEGLPLVTPIVSPQVSDSDLQEEWLNDPMSLQGVYNHMANLLQNDGVQGKVLLRKEVTEAMRTTKQTFDQFKKVTLEQLKSAEQTLSQPQQKALLQKTIEAVDHLIMKSDVPLFASMKLEKKLLVLSSDLQDVKKLVDQGKLSEAKSSLKQVIQTLESLTFQPSAKKVIYQSGFINSGLSLEDTVFKGKGLDLSGILGKQIASFSEIKGSPRMVLEHLRGLGLNLEGEAHQSRNQQNLSKNLSKQKTIYDFLEALSEEGSDNRGKKEALPVEKALAQSLGAHRLINKLEEGSPKQTIDLTIPYRLDQGVFELKVHIEARKQNELLDWENFKMFFVLEAPKVGQVGIGLHTVDKKLSLTVKAENRRALQVLAPVADVLKKDLVGVGYQLVGIQYGLLQRYAIEEETIQPEGTPEVVGDVGDAISRKGVDYKV